MDPIGKPRESVFSMKGPERTDGMKIKEDYLNFTERVVIVMFTITGEIRSLRKVFLLLTDRPDGTYNLLYYVYYLWVTNHDT